MTLLARVFVVIFIVLAGCVAPSHQATVINASRASFVALPGEFVTTTSDGGAEMKAFSDEPKTSDQERLEMLWKQRTQMPAMMDYPIGPGDLLEIDVAGVDELSNRSARVSGEGTIALPYVNIVRAAGLTEEELRAELRRRLEQYMYTPQVNLFIREYRSRQVAVVGAVQKPGLYSLASGTDTILDVLSLAGGMKEEAAPRLNFIPARHIDRSQAVAAASTAAAKFAAQNQHPLIMKDKDEDPICINLNDHTQSSQQMYLALPVRPGDVIMVPGSGEVLVQGWVGKPGSYKITPGLTVLGAVAAAGGPLFPANTGSVKLIRLSAGGKKHVSVVNLESIHRGEETDGPVQAGDIIELSSSAAKLVPYGFYSFLSQVLHFGTSLPLY